MKRIHSAALCLAAALFASSAAAADDILVIPDVTAAYLYDGAGSRRTLGNQISLALFKEGHFKEYLIESDPPGLTCDEKCEETAQLLPEGKVTLRIVGKKPVTFLDIPLTGRWSDECAQSEDDDESAKCVVNLDEMTAQIRVTVNPNIEVGTLMPLPEGGTAMIMQVNSQEGTVTVAGHQLLGPGALWLDFDKRRRTEIGAKSLLDGRANIPKLLASATLFTAGSEAADYCKQLQGGQYNWYLPARDELALLTKPVLDKIPGIDPDNYLWSSTESSLSISKNKTTGAETYTHQAHAMNNSSASMSNNRDAYKCKVTNDGITDCTNLRRYQTLCFRRLPI